MCFYKTEYLAKFSFLTNIDIIININYTCHYISHAFPTFT